MLLQRGIEDGEFREVAAGRFRKRKKASPVERVCEVVT